MTRKMTDLRLYSLLLAFVALCFAIAQHASALEFDDLSTELRSAMDQEFERFLRENPDLLLELVLEAADRRQAESQLTDAQMIAANYEEIFEDTHSWRGGNPDGDVVIVEFADYRCPYCRRMYDPVQEVVEEDGQIVHIVKEFPILGEESVFLAALAIAILDKFGADEYADLRDQLMGSEQSLQPEFLREMMSRFGQDSSVSETLIFEASEQPLSLNLALASRLMINGTPAFIIGNQILRGAIPKAGLIDQVAASREQAQQE